MKENSEIQGRIRFLVSEEFNFRLAEASKRLPHKCEHNYRHTLDSRKTVEGEPNPLYNKLSSNGHLPVIQSTIGLCMLDANKPEEWKGNICEDPIDAQRCPYFSMKDTKTSILTEFYTNLQDLDWVRENMPETYGLLWSLESTILPDLPWWKKLWFKMFRLRPDPILETGESLTHQLLLSEDTN